MLLSTLVAISASLLAFANNSKSGPVTKLSYGSFRGTSDGLLDSFLGIPYAQPPVGSLRFAPPQPPKNIEGIQEATVYGAACHQQQVTQQVNPVLAITNPFPALANISEDCLFINVIKPTNLPEGKKVPVIFWIFGAGFVISDTSQLPGNNIVNRSILLNEPVIFVSANFRLNIFGFLPGKEILDAGFQNAGFRDQSLALQWVHDNIGAFGGDNTKVTFFGDASGAISIGLHMLSNGGDNKGLFRAAFMASGSPSFPMHTVLAGQSLYNFVLNSTNCTGASDTLHCLQGLPASALQTAADATPQLLSAQALQLGWAPRIDNDTVVNPFRAINAGQYAKVPFISGGVDDEGTLFSFNLQNISTNQDFIDYVSNNYVRDESLAQNLSQVFPDDLTSGSPFDTGNLNTVTPQFKRLAAFTGDFFFQAPRRWFIEIASKTQPTYGYTLKRLKATPIFGSAHQPNVTEFFAFPDLPGLQPDFIGTDALINFVNTLDPNQPPNNISLLTQMGINWPLYNSSADRPLLGFVDPIPNVTIIADNYRAQTIAVANDILEIVVNRDEQNNA